jgi:hypothetical protein
MDLLQFLRPVHIVERLVARAHEVHDLRADGRGQALRRWLPPGCGAPGPPPARRKAALQPLYMANRQAQSFGRLPIGDEPRHSAIAESRAVGGFLPAHGDRGLHGGITFSLTNYPMTFLRITSTR